MVSIDGEIIKKAIPKFSLTDFSLIEYFNEIKPLLLFILGVTIYSIFIFKFYKFLTKRDIIKLNPSGYQKGFFGQIEKIGTAIVYLLENLILTPIFIVFWFAIITTLMLLISKNQTAESLILTSMALVAAVRITAYYNESLSQDLAKMIPFTLLGIFLIDVNYFSVKEIINIAKEIPSLLTQLGYYLAFVIILETILRILQTLIQIIRPRKQSLESIKKSK
mgnify:CR=1 FL=1